MHKNQCKIAKQIPNEYRRHIPTTELPKRAVADLLKKYKTINLNYDNSYTPQTPIEPKAQLNNYLIQGDNNPRWFKPEECRYCSSKTDYHRLHNLLVCKQYTRQKKQIMDSISIELDFYAKKYNTQIHTIIEDGLHAKILDIASCGYTEKHDIHDIFSLLVGGKINRNLKLKYSIPIKRMLIAHTLLLIQITQNRLKLPPNPEFVKIENTNILLQDLQQGKIIARTKTETNKLTILNMRNQIERMTIPYHYNLGLGSATTRTTKQKRLANQYTKRIIDESDNNIIFVDGSVKFGADNKPTNRGGFGGILINKNNNQTITQFYEHVKTNDPQQAELHGIRAAIQLANKIYNTQNYDRTTILCDCKNAVKCVTGEYRVPWKYSKIYQTIKEELVTNNGYHISIKWIPGHTDNKQNEEADRLAKLATEPPKPPPPGNRSLIRFSCLSRIVNC